MSAHQKTGPRERGVLRYNQALSQHVRRPVALFTREGHLFFSYEIDKKNLDPVADPEFPMGRCAILYFPNNLPNPSVLGCLFLNPPLISDGHPQSNFWIHP